MSKEHAYAYEAGYRDGSINYELDHCPACKNVADLQEVLEENAKLREQIHWLKKGDILHVLTDQEYIDQCERERLMQVSIDALDKENAKLRELVRDMNKWLWNGADCTECPFAAKCDLNAAFESDLHAHICLGWSEIHDRMRELGVEV